MGANNESPGIRTHSGFIDQRDEDLVKRAMFLQQDVKHALILDVLLWRFWKLGCPSLLLFFGAWSQVDLESGLGNVDFLACCREEDEIPFFLVQGDGIHSVVIPELCH